MLRTFPCAYWPFGFRLVWRGFLKSSCVSLVLLIYRDLLSLIASLGDLTLTSVKYTLHCSVFFRLFVFNFQNSRSLSASGLSVPQVLDTVFYSQLSFSCMWQNWTSWLTYGCVCVGDVWGCEEHAWVPSVLVQQRFAKTITSSEMCGVRKMGRERRVSKLLLLALLTPLHFPGLGKPSVSPLFSNTRLSPLPEDIRSFVLCLCLGNGCVDVTCFGSSERNRFVSFHSRRQLGNSLPSKHSCSPSLCHSMNQRRGHRVLQCPGIAEHILSHSLLL